MTTVFIVLAIVALLATIFEDIIHINKAKTTLFIGTLSWVLYYVTALENVPHEVISERFADNLLEIATLWLFLMAAMTFVAYLNSRNIIRHLVQEVLPPRMHERTLLLLIGGFAFVFSMLADNITTTLITLAVYSSVDMPAHKRIKYAALIVFAVNSGGVGLVTGEVTTLMIFLAGKVSITDLLALVLPSLLAVLLLALMLFPGLNRYVDFEHHDYVFTHRDRFIMGAFLITILLTLVLNIGFDVPPVLTFLFGLSAMFLLDEWFKSSPQDEPILHYIREIHFDTLLFFLGVLLIVGLLQEIGVLFELVKLYDWLPVAWANFLMGVLSSLIDNVPMTAAVIKADIPMSQLDWLALTYATGVGGSILVIGSAAGIITMGKMKEVTFFSYGKIFLPLFVAYGFGYLANLWFTRWLFL
ncbi:MAG TPA: sodium:proton antiporter NhaD [Pseudomonadales bacterium]|nr:sodium:proton antiporter NhaD [Pseudomonadales bacterium]